MALVVCRCVRRSTRPQEETDLTVTRKAVYAKIGPQPSLCWAPPRATHSPTAVRSWPNCRDPRRPAPRIPGADRGREPPARDRAPTRPADGRPGGRIARPSRSGVRPGRRVGDRRDPCEDAHAQERSSRRRCWPWSDGHVWVADRNFCTTRLLFGFVAAAGTSSSATRIHLSVRGSSPAVECGRTPTGAVSEGSLRVGDADGAEMIVRRVTITLALRPRTAGGDPHPGQPPGRGVGGNDCCGVPGPVADRGAFHELEARHSRRGGNARVIRRPHCCVLCGAGGVQRVTGVKAAIGAGHGIDAGAEVSGSDLAEEVAGTPAGNGDRDSRRRSGRCSPDDPSGVGQLASRVGAAGLAAGFRKQPRGREETPTSSQSGVISLQK